MTKKAMVLSEFVNLLDVHGSDIDAWPTSEKAAAQQLLKVSSEVQCLFDKQTELDRALEQIAVPEFTGLAQLICNQALPRRKLSIPEQLIEWLIPRRSPGLWRPALAACLPLIFGVMLGIYYSFGIGEDPLADEAWSDELYILALNAYDQSL